MYFSYVGGVFIIFYLKIDFFMCRWSNYLKDYKNLIIIYILFSRFEKKFF